MSKGSWSLVSLIGSWLDKQLIFFSSHLFPSCCDPVWFWGHGSHLLCGLKKHLNNARQ